MPQLTTFFLCQLLVSCLHVWGRHQMAAAVQQPLNPAMPQSGSALPGSIACTPVADLSEILELCWVEFKNEGFKRLAVMEAEKLMFLAFCLAGEQKHHKTSCFAHGLSKHKSCHVLKSCKYR